MTLKEIPLSAVPFQTVSAVVNGQQYRITVRQLGAFLYTSVTVDGTKVTDTVAATVATGIIPWAQNVADTNPYFVDTQGSQAPQYEGIGERWVLLFDEVDG